MSIDLNCIVNWELWQKLQKARPIDTKYKYVRYEKEDESYNPYCPECSACGEEGCCSALCCKQSPKGHYCKWYLRDLRFGYAMYRDIYELIPQDAETQAKLDKIWNDNYDIFYRDK